MKEKDIIEKLKSGVKLFQYKRFATAGNSLSSKIIQGKDIITYKFEDNTTIHHLTGKSLLKKKIVTPGDRTKTLGGWCTELKLAN